ncbi:unnamed protein product [Sphagnum jensenii]|uniref:Uncharacterized protein n=1 Tax=Sphagnum jensenii TaxID=128206 RepID=A0ABP0VCF0_9BRYO
MEWLYSLATTWRIPYLSDTPLARRIFYGMVVQLVAAPPTRNQNFLASPPVQTKQIQEVHGSSSANGVVSLVTSNGNPIDKLGDDEPSLEGLVAALPAYAFACLVLASKILDDICITARQDKLTTANKTSFIERPLWMRMRDTYPNPVGDLPLHPPLDPLFAVCGRVGVRGPPAAVLSPLALSRCLEPPYVYHVPGCGAPPMACQFVSDEVPLQLFSLPVHEQSTCVRLGVTRSRRRTGLPCSVPARGHAMDQGVRVSSVHGQAIGGVLSNHYINRE